MFDRADVTYRYDGSFEGMLCCVFESFARRELPASVAPPDRGQLTFTPEVWIETDPEHARRVFASVSKKISKAAAQLVSDIFLGKGTGADPLSAPGVPLWRRCDGHAGR